MAKQSTPDRSQRWSLNPSAARARMANRIQGRHSDEGITLVEVMMAFIILMITMVPMGYLLTSTVQASATARQHQAALQLADSWMEILSNSNSATNPPTRADGTIITGQAQNLTTAPAGAETPNSTLVGTTYTAQATYDYVAVDNQGQSDLCSDGEPPSPTHPGVIELQVTVSWDGGRQSVSDSTNIDYPKPGLQTEGFISLQLNNDGESDIHGNSSASRLNAIPVSIDETSGPNGTAATLSPNPDVLNPDQNGCVFAQVPVGTYSVSVGQPSAGSLPLYSGSPPFVNTSGATSESATNQIVTVTAQQTVSLNQFDEGLNTAISYGGATAVDGGVECPGADGLTCLASGNGTSTASAAWGGSSTWSSATLPGITNLSQVACTSGGSPTCVGVGDSTSGGAIMTTSTDLNTTAADAVPSIPNVVTDITQVVCPSANGCYALGTTASGPVLLAGAVGQTGPHQDIWTEVAPPASTTFNGLASIACPTSSTCELTGSATVGTAASAAEIFRLDGDPATLVTNPGWTPTFTTDSLPTANGSSTVSSVDEVTCPTSTECLAVATNSTSPTGPTILTATIGSSGASTWSDESFPSGAAAITGLSCTSTTCVAIGSMPGPTAAVWAGYLTATPHTWALIPSGANGIPTSVLAATSVACGQPATGDIADCVIATSTSLAAPGQLLDGSFNGAWAWNFATPPPAPGVLYYTGVACESPPSASRSTCAAAGATASGPIIATAAHGPSGTWTAQTPASLPGATVTGIPLEMTPAGISNWTTPISAGGTPNASQLPNVLYPYASGYSLAAGDCSAEANSTSITPLTALPGGTATAVVPLGLLPLQVVNASGAPVSGATVVITSTSCGAPGDTYTLPVTDADGLTRTSVPYGNYSYTVTVGATTTTPATTFSVNANSVSIPETVQGPPTVVGTPNYLPGPVEVPSS